MIAGCAFLAGNAGKARRPSVTVPRQERAGLLHFQLLRWHAVGIPDAFY